MYRIAIALFGLAAAFVCGLRLRELNSIFIATDAWRGPPVTRMQSMSAPYGCILDPFQMSRSLWLAGGLALSDMNAELNLRLA